MKRRTLSLVDAPADAVPGFRETLAGPDGPGRDIVLSFDHDGFDDACARASWLRTAYLTLFAVTGYRAIVEEQMDVVRRQIQQPKVAHISTFLIDTRDNEDWSDRAFVRVKTPEWLRC